MHGEVIVRAEIFYGWVEFWGSSQHLDCAVKRHVVNRGVSKCQERELLEGAVAIVRLTHLALETMGECRFDSGGHVAIEGRGRSRGGDCEQHAVTEPVVLDGKLG